MLATYEISQVRPNEQLLDYTYLFHQADVLKSSVLTVKALLIGFLTMHIYPNNVAESWLLRTPLPEVMPPY